MRYCQPHVASPVERAGEDVVAVQDLDGAALEDLNLIGRLVVDAGEVVLDVELVLEVLRQFLDEAEVGGAQQQLHEEVQPHLSTDRSGTA